LGLNYLKTLSKVFFIIKAIAVEFQKNQRGWIKKPLKQLNWEKVSVALLNANQPILVLGWFAKSACY
jgi:hypothetical protein